MPNTVQLKKNGQPVFPVTDVSLVMGLAERPLMDAVYAWDGTGTPDITKIPAGVTVEYNSTTYTGTLAASADTTARFYLVPSTTVPGEYDRYLTDAVSGSYSWKSAGTTAIPTPSIVDNLESTDPTKALSAKQGKVLNEELGELEAKVDEIEDGTNSVTMSSLGNNIKAFKFLSGKTYKVVNNTSSGCTFNLTDADGNVIQAVSADINSGSSKTFTANQNADYFKSYMNATGTLTIVLMDSLNQRMNVAEQNIATLSGDVATLQKNEALGRSLYNDLVLGYYGFSGDSITVNSHATIKMASISVKEGDLIYLQNKGGDSARAWYLTDANNQITRKALSAAYSDFTNSPLLLTVAPGETKLYVNVYPVNGVYGNVVVYDAAVLPIIFNAKTSDIVLGYYGNTGGKVVFNSHASIKCGKIPCKKGDFVYLQNLGGAGSAKAYFITDSSDNILFEYGTGLRDFFHLPSVIEITEANAAYIYFNSYAVGGVYGLVYVQDGKYNFMAYQTAKAVDERFRNEAKHDLIVGKGFSFTADGAYLVNNGNETVLVKMLTPTNNPLLLSICSKSDNGNGNVVVTYNPDVVDGFKTQVNNLVGYYYLPSADYNVYSFLLPPFLFASGKIQISLSSHLTVREITLCEAPANRMNRGTVLFTSHLGYLLGYNTLPAFKMAAKVGFSACVANLRPTADDVMVCAHDDNFTASSDGQTYYISQKTYAEIEALGYRENGNSNARPYIGEQHLVTVEEFLQVCATTGMKPIFSSKSDVDYEALTALFKKYGFDGKDDVTFKAFTTSLIESAYAGLGDKVRYVKEIYNDASLDANIASWVAVNLGNATKLIELNRSVEFTETDVQKCSATGYKVSIFDAMMRNNSRYRDWVAWGVSEFTTDNMISGGCEWM